MEDSVLCKDVLFATGRGSSSRFQIRLGVLAPGGAFDRPKLARMGTRCAMTTT